VTAALIGASARRLDRHGRPDAWDGGWPGDEPRRVRLVPRCLADDDGRPSSSPTRTRPAAPATGWCTWSRSPCPRCRPRRRPAHGRRRRDGH